MTSAAATNGARGRSRGNSPPPPSSHSSHSSFSHELQVWHSFEPGFEYGASPGQTLQSSSEVEFVFTLNLPPTHALGRGPRIPFRASLVDRDSGAVCVNVVAAVASIVPPEANSVPVHGGAAAHGKLPALCADKNISVCNIACVI